MTDPEDDAPASWPLRLVRSLRPSRWPSQLQFTREGRWYCLIALGVGFAAINTGNNLLYLVLGMLLSLIVASGILSNLSLRGLRLSRQLPPRIHAGRWFLVGIGVENGKRRLPSFSIEVEDRMRERVLEKRCYFLKIPAGRLQHTSYRYQIPRRGRYRFTGLRVATKFPFGLFRKSRWVALAGEAIVYPTLVPAPPPDAAHSDGAGGERCDRLGRDGEFFGVRAFREGDAWRDVHWRTSARAGRLMVREHEADAMPALAIVLDNARPPGAPADPRDDDEFERAVSVAAAIATQRVQRGFAVSLVTRTARVPAGAGQAHLSRVLCALALLDWADPSLPLPLPSGRAAGLVRVRRAGRVSAALRAPERP